MKNKKLKREDMKNKWRARSHISISPTYENSKRCKNMQGKKRRFYKTLEEEESAVHLYAIGFLPLRIKGIIRFGIDTAATTTARTRR